MRIAALALIAAGVLLTAGSALAPAGFDFAVSVQPGWHMTVFPSTFIGVLVFMSGVVVLLASLVGR
jgi:hypothetical protein